MRATAKLIRGSGKMLAQVSSFPAPVGGWDAISPIAEMPPNRAYQLDNWTCRPGWLEIRRGMNAWSTGVGGASTSVETLMTYNGTTASKLFSIGGGTIYDSTSSGAASSTGQTGLSNSRWQYVNFTDGASNHWLVLANGADAPLKYDGTTWSAFAPTGITLTTIVDLAVHKGRLWLVPTNSTAVYYMPVQATAGAATAFELGPFLSKGGYIQAVGTWSVDTRQTVDDYWAAITSRGQVVVYQGTDPSSASTWALVGVYDLGASIGRRCFLKVAGDLFLITLDGVIPMSQMLSTDRASANRVSLTANIMSQMNASAKAYSSNFGWQLVEYPKSTLIILNIPTTQNSVSQQYVMNTLTGGWSRWTGQNVNCLELFNDNLFVGANNGKVYQTDQDSADDTTPITATVKTAFNYFGSRGVLKRFTMIRPIITTDSLVTPGVGLNVDFQDTATASTPSAAQTAGALWDQAIWDQSSWPVNSNVTAFWQSISGIGQCASVVTAVQSAHTGAANGVTLNLNGWDIAYESGGVI